MRAEIIAVGTELLSPSRPETNSLFLTRRFNALGISVRRKFIVGDREDDVAEVLASALEKADVVIVTGGLGPTNDDITRAAVSRLLCLPLYTDPAILEQIRTRYRKSGQAMPANNARQAEVPEGAEILPNRNGTAPGLFLRRQDCLIFLLPGPPRELQPMVDEQVVPRIRQLKSTSSLQGRMLRVGGEPESKVDASIEQIYLSYPEIETTILASLGVVDLFFVWKGVDQTAAESQLEELVERVRRELGPAVFSNCDEPLAAAVGRGLKEKGYSLAVAESCTGGWIGKLLTDVPGSSEYFFGGVICYSDQLKTGLVGVDPEVLRQQGAVSEAVALQLAEGVRRNTQADVALSVTGIAGPGGGTESKPVGLVYAGLCGPFGREVKLLTLGGERETIRFRSAQLALDWLRRKLL